MKLRILDDSVRLRLSRSEVATLAEAGMVEASTRFPGGEVLVYAVTAGDVSQAMARMVPGRIEVTLPRRAAHAWATAEDVSIRCDVETAHGPFRVLVEKDFACLIPREGEDVADRYPNPKRRESNR